MSEDRPDRCSDGFQPLPIRADGCHRQHPSLVAEGSIVVFRSVLRRQRISCEVTLLALDALPVPETSPGHLPDAFRPPLSARTTPPGQIQDTARALSGHLLQSFRAPRGNLPDTSRTPPGHLSGPPGTRGESVTSQILRSVKTRALATVMGVRMPPPITMFDGVKASAPPPKHVVEAGEGASAKTPKPRHLWSQPTHRVLRPPQKAVARNHPEFIARVVHSLPRLAIIVPNPVCIARLAWLWATKVRPGLPRHRSN